MNTGKESLLGSLRVLDLTDEKGFLCGKILADLGADVIKIERPQGDPGRRLGPFYKDIPHNERSLFWAAYNINKRSITLDIETRDGAEIFGKLVRVADLVVESFQPGYLERIGLGYSTISEWNPRIILTSITAFGQTGPYAEYKASDMTVWAFGGMMYVCGDVDRPPVQVSFPQAFLHASAEAAVGSLIAHYYRQRTGKGQHVDVSAQQCVVQILMSSPAEWGLNRAIVKRKGPCQVVGNEPPRRLHWRCKDGFVCFGIFAGITGARSIRALIEWMESEGMGNKALKETDWDSISFSKLTQEEIDAWEKPIADFFLTHTKGELTEGALKRKYIMLFPVNTCKDILEDPQLESLNYWRKITDPELGTELTYPGPFASVAGLEYVISRPAPRIGQHNDEVYGDLLGLNKDDLIVLKEANII